MLRSAGITFKTASRGSGGGGVVPPLLDKIFNNSRTTEVMGFNFWKIEENLFAQILMNKNYSPRAHRLVT